MASFHDKRSGGYVTIRHGNYTVSYCHLSKALVRKSIVVKPGEVVAITGNTGRSTGEHLHLSAKYKGKYINPNILLQYIEDIRKETIANLMVTISDFISTKALLVPSSLGTRSAFIDNGKFNQQIKNTLFEMIIGRYNVKKILSTRRLSTKIQALGYSDKNVEPFYRVNSIISFS